VAWPTVGQVLFVASLKADLGVNDPLAPTGLQEALGGVLAAGPQPVEDSDPLPQAAGDPPVPHVVPHRPRGVRALLGQGREARGRVRRELQQGHRPRHLQRLHQQLLGGDGPRQAGIQTEDRPCRLLQGAYRCSRGAMSFTTL
jgi:hypothetical protein